MRLMGIGIGIAGFWEIYKCLFNDPYLHIESYLCAERLKMCSHFDTLLRYILKIQDKYQECRGLSNQGAKYP